MDKPVTDAELEEFYGKTVSQSAVDAAIERHVKAFDADDLVQAISNEASAVLLLVKQGISSMSIGIVVCSLARQLIADRVSIELFGRHGCVKADEVEL